MGDSVFIVMPAYNEEETIEKTVKQWYPVLRFGNDNSRIVIVNDGSKDRTLSILEDLAVRYPKLVFLDKPNGGHGPAVLCSYRYAIAQGADYVFQTDSDGQTLPEEFEPFWGYRKSYDMVVGRREVRTDGLFRLIATRGLRLIIRAMFGVFVQDANIAYRLMRRDALEECVRLIPEHFFLANVMVSILFAKKRMAVKSIPVTVLPRQGGVNSVFAPQIIKIGLRAVADFYKMRKSLRKTSFMAH